MKKKSDCNCNRSYALRRLDLQAADRVIQSRIRQLALKMQSRLRPRMKVIRAHRKRRSLQERLMT